MGWQRLQLDPLRQLPGAAAEGEQGQRATHDPVVELSTAERAELRGWLARLTEESEAPGIPDGGVLDDAAPRIAVATLVRLVDQLERQRCVAFTGAELSRLLVLLARLRARCAAARAEPLARSA